MADCIVCTGANIEQILPTLLEWDAVNNCWYFRTKVISAFTCENYTCNSEQDFKNLLARSIECGCDGRPVLRIGYSLFDAENTLTQVCQIQNMNFWQLLSLAFVKDVVTGEFALSLGVINCDQAE